MVVRNNLQWNEKQAEVDVKVPDKNKNVYLIINIGRTNKDWVILY